MIVEIKQKSIENKAKEISQETEKDRKQGRKVKTRGLVQVIHYPNNQSSRKKVDKGKKSS